MPIRDDIRYQLIVLAERSSARDVCWSPDRPTDWRPQQVRNPQGVIEMYFNNTSAWELIAEELKAGCPVEEVGLNKPPGAKGYVLLIDLEPNQP